jgi:hypothetical protein
MSRRVGPLSSMLAFVLLILSAEFQSAQAQKSPLPNLPPCPIDEQEGCPQQIPCTALNCVPLPTSLFPVGPNIRGRGGFFAGSGDCGSKSCAFLRCPCGPKLTNGDVCEPDGGGGCG